LVVDIWRRDVLFDEGGCGGDWLMADVQRGLTVVLVMAGKRLVELARGWRRVLMAGRVRRLRDAAVVAISRQRDGLFGGGVYGGDGLIFDVRRGFTVIFVLAVVGLIAPVWIE
jgi:hypothetical protein